MEVNFTHDKLMLEEYSEHLPEMLYCWITMIGTNSVTSQILQTTWQLVYYKC